MEGTFYKVLLTPKQACCAVILNKCHVIKSKDIFFLGPLNIICQVVVGCGLGWQKSDLNIKSK